jgi:uncharacterized protein (UPF0333 family)
MCQNKEVFKMLNRKGQNTAEYAILIALVVAVAVGTQTYIKRGVQARMRDESHKLTADLSGSGDWAAISNRTVSLDDQWEPNQLSKKSTQNVTKDEQKSTLEKTGVVTRDVNRTTSQAAGDYQRYGY